MCINAACCYHEGRSGCIHNNKYKLPVVEITKASLFINLPEDAFVFKCRICDKEHICSGIKQHWRAC